MTVLVGHSVGELWIDRRSGWWPLVSVRRAGAVLAWGLCVGPLAIGWVPLGHIGDPLWRRVLSR
jgi:1,4-dihydroxy-2-naphthoate octaprenyltransferase